MPPPEGGLEHLLTSCAHCLRLLVRNEDHFPDLPSINCIYPHLNFFTMDFYTKSIQEPRRMLKDMRLAREQTGDSTMAECAICLVQYRGGPIIIEMRTALQYMLPLLHDCAELCPWIRTELHACHSAICSYLIQYGDIIAPWVLDHRRILLTRGRNCPRRLKLWWEHSDDALDYQR